MRDLLAIIFIFVVAFALINFVIYISFAVAGASFAPFAWDEDTRGGFAAVCILVNLLLPFITVAASVDRH